MKTTKKDSKKKRRKGIKTFPKYKKVKGEKKFETDIKNFLKNKVRNYLSI